MLFIMQGKSLAQGHYPMSAEFVEAIKNGTRTSSGLPGTNYFQNHSDYTIKVKFDPNSGILKGEETVIYHNNSPNPITKLVVRLYQNVFQKASMRDEKVNITNIHDGVKIHAFEFMINDEYKDISHLSKTNGTILKVKLPNDIEPGSQGYFRIAWEVKMPMTKEKRIGKFGNNNYFIGLWYPQISVYDDIEGWDYTPYTISNEFYNDFNNYRCEIEVPADYMIWATGKWLNYKDLLKEETRIKYEQSRTSDSTVRICVLDENNHIFNARKKHTFIYQADKVPDFAFGVSNEYAWDAGSVLSESPTKNRIHIQMAYDENDQEFSEMLQIGRKLIKHMEEVSYQIDFPYDQISLFNGHGGMEYPMIVNNGTTNSEKKQSFLVMHEFAHMYFPFATGLNEHKYSWIDEGLTSYLPLITADTFGLEYFNLEDILKRYAKNAGNEWDVPLCIPSQYLSDKVYNYYSYSKSSIAFYILEEYMGSESFREGLKKFYHTWFGKHPTPNDMFAIFDSMVEKDLGWIVEKLFCSHYWADISLEKSMTKDQKNQISIKNTGGLPVPVNLQFIYHDGPTRTIIYSPEIWKNTDIFTYEFEMDENLESIKANMDYIPDVDKSNNILILGTEPGH